MYCCVVGTDFGRLPTFSHTHKWSKMEINMPHVKINIFRFPYIFFTSFLSPARSLSTNVNALCFVRYLFFFHFCLLFASLLCESNNNNKRNWPRKIRWNFNFFILQIQCSESVVALKRMCSHINDFINQRSNLSLCINCNLLLFVWAYLTAAVQSM